MEKAAKKTTPSKEASLSSSHRADDTITIKVPKIQQGNTTNIILVGLLVIAAYLLGMLTTKVQYLEQQKKLVTQPPTTAQNNIAPTTPPPQTISPDTLKSWAKDIGLNMGKFSSCFDSQKYKSLVDQDINDGKTAGVNGTPTFFINGSPLVGAQPYNTFKQALDKELANAGNILFLGQAFAQTDISPTAQPRVAVGMGRLPPLGSRNGKITFVEFSDFQCPFCNSFFKNTFSQLKKDYVDTRKAVIYYRHFPLDFHPNAMPFALASECANEQGKFWEMHNKIFGEQ